MCRPIRFLYLAVRSDPSMLVARIMWLIGMHKIQHNDEKTHQEKRAETPPSEQSKESVCRCTRTHCTPTGISNHRCLDPLVTKPESLTTFIYSNQQGGATRNVGQSAVIVGEKGFAA